MNKRKLRRILRESIRQVLLVENPNIDAAVEEVMEKVNSGYVADPNSIYRACQAACLLYTSPSPRDVSRSRMPSSA